MWPFKGLARIMLFVLATETIQPSTLCQLLRFVVVFVAVRYGVDLFCRTIDEPTNQADQSNRSNQPTDFSLTQPQTPTNEADIAKSNECTFMRLPYEMREMIYKLALPPPRTRDRLYKLVFKKTDGRALATIPSISQTCKQIREETLRIWLGQNVFLFHREAWATGHQFQSWLNTLGPHAVFIKDIAFHLHMSHGIRSMEPELDTERVCIRMKIQRGNNPCLSGVGKGLFRSQRVDDEPMRPLEYFRSNAESRGEAMDTLNRIARHVTPHGGERLFITSKLGRIVETACDFDEGEMIHIDVRGWRRNGFWRESYYCHR